MDELYGMLYILWLAYLGQHSKGSNKTCTSAMVHLCRVWGGDSGCYLQALLPAAGVAAPEGVRL